jgi:hypothetical protein
LVRGVDRTSFEPHIATAIELQVGKARIAVGLTLIDRIIETPCTPMPLTHALVRGIAFDDQRPIVCVFLGRKTTETPPTITAVILSHGGPVAWALCADKVYGVVPVIERSALVDARLPSWLARVRAADGRLLAWLDPELMIRDIGGEAAS